MKFLRHVFIIILFINLLLSCATQSKLKEQKSEDRPEYDLRPFYVLAVRGDMAEAIGMLDTIVEHKLSDEKLALKKQFRDRFIEHKDTDTVITGDPLIDGTLQGFYRYWGKVLMDKTSLDPAKDELLSSLTELIYRHQFHGNMPRDTIMANLQKYLTESIIDRGYFTNALNSTGAYLDLFLWHKQQDSIFTVQLPEDEIDVHVVLMDDFLSIGWTEYATMGKYYAGGWANRRALYCVKKAYDLSSESFQVSYLTHEAQHFYDYMNFPSLEQPDLEYRAKLAELHAAEETGIALLKKFILNAKHDRSYAHSFANYHVIHDLSQVIFNEDFVNDAEKWAQIPVERIRTASRLLLAAHTQALRAVGAEQVRAYLK